MLLRISIALNDWSDAFTYAQHISQATENGDIKGRIREQAISALKSKVARDAFIQDMLPFAKKEDIEQIYDDLVRPYKWFVCGKCNECEIKGFCKYDAHQTIQIALAGEQMRFDDANPYADEFYSKLVCLSQSGV